MKIFRVWFKRLEALVSKQDRHGDLAAELELHAAMHVEDNIRSGMTEEEARRQAFLKLGGVTSAAEAYHEQKTIPVLENLLLDLRYALFQLRKAPAFSIAAILTLAIAIGAVTSVFSGVYSLLIRPLPFPDSASLVWISSHWPKARLDAIISPDLIAARQRLHSFENLSAFTFGTSNLTGAEGALRVARADVTANFLATLKVAPALGRDFAPQEDEPGRAKVALLSNRLWRQRFGADPKIVGRSILLDGEGWTVVGVLPSGFLFPDMRSEPDLYVPLALERTTAITLTKPVFSLRVIGRLRRGVALGQAGSEMQALLLARLKTYPVQFQSIARGMESTVDLLQRHLIGNTRDVLVILLCAVAFLLLLACANIANLQLGRALQRRHEVAVRFALGAGRGRILQQFFLESALLSCGGALLGLAFSGAVATLIQHSERASALDASLYGRAARLFGMPFGKLSAAIHLDGWMFLFALVVSAGAAILFGLAPALSGSRANPSEELKAPSSRMTAGREHQWLRHTFLIAEVTLAVALLCSAGLVTRSFVNLMRYQPGFDPRDTLTGTTQISNSPNVRERIRLFASELLPRLQNIPGVKSAAIASTLPLQPYDLYQFLSPEGENASQNTKQPVPLISISPDYFRAAGTRLLTGRTFSDADTPNSIPVAIVNQTFAQRFFQGDALNKRFSSGAPENKLTIVGIVENTRRSGLTQASVAEIYRPFSQLPQPAVGILLRSQVDSALLAKGLRDAVRRSDPDQPLFDIQTMELRVSEQLAERRLMASLLAVFALLAIALSTVGIYGVFSYSVTRRSQEMSIRMALGSSRPRVVRLVLSEGVRLIAIGILLGGGLAWMSSRLLTNQLVGVSAHDPWTFVTVVLLMAVTGIAASFLPAMRASRNELAAALRAE